MPLYFQTKRRRKRTLREQMLDKKYNKFINTQEEEPDVEYSRKTTNTLSSTPASLQGSFLRNKLDNPLFQRTDSVTSSRLKNVREASDSEEDSDSDDSSSEESVTDVACDKNAKIRSRRFGSSFFTKARISSDSSSSNSSNDEENKQNSGNTRDYLMYTAKGQAVKVQFLLDYLQISPVYYKLSLTRQKLKTKLIYYEDIAYWTSNSTCLRLIHISNIDTILQKRSEIKLYLPKKKRNVRIDQVLGDFKEKISVLLSNKYNIDIEKAISLLNKSNSTKDINKVVQIIEKKNNKCLVQNFDLLNV